MANKSFEFMFALAASINSSFNSSFSTATGKVRTLQGSIKDLNKTQSQLNTAFSQGLINTKSYENAQQQLDKMNRSLQKAAGTEMFQKSMVNATAFYYGVKNLAGALAGPTQAAMEFESTMADVNKVVQFDSAAEFAEMNAAILEMSKNIPMTAKGLGEIVAAGGQAGIAKEDLVAFGEDAAKMGVAFNIAAGDAGEKMAKWRTAFRMNQQEVVVLGDKINYLGNTTAASAPKISDVVTRIGPLGEVGGVASGEIAALGASMVGAGIESELASTGIKNMILSLTAGESATKRQADAFAALGLDATQMAQAMQTDAKGSILTVLERLKQLDKATQASIMKDLFGRESISAIAPLLSNLEGLKDNFNKVSDATLYAGSMQKEFDTRCKTTENSTQLMRNKIKAAEIAIGRGLLPVVATGSEMIGNMASVVGDLATKYPNVTKGAVMLGGAIIGLIAVGHMYNLVTAAGQAAIAAFSLAQKAHVVGMRLWTVTLNACTVAQRLFNLALATTPIGWILIGIGLLIAAGVALYQNWDTVCAFISEVWENPKKAILDFTAFVENKFTATIDWLAGKWQGLKDFFSSPVKGQVEVSSNGEVAHNAAGGIYGKGAFLTTFAENSGESAIPHAPTRRNIGLLAKTNAIMGNPLGGSPINATFAPQITVNGGDKNEVKQAIDDAMSKFEAMLQRVAEKQRRVSYE